MYYSFEVLIAWVWEIGRGAFIAGYKERDTDGAANGAAIGATDGDGAGNMNGDYPL